MANRTDLIHRALRNLGALPMGQAPNAEEYQSVSDLADAMVAELNARDIVYIADLDSFDDKFLISLGHVLAWKAAPEFGAAADQALAALAVDAEQKLIKMESTHPTYAIAESVSFYWLQFHSRAPLPQARCHKKALAGLSTPML